MSNFIEFTTLHAEITFGNPVHDGKLPKRFRDVEGVRVDGETVDFVDKSIPDRMHRYFLEAPELERRGIVNDCVAFVALMNSVELKNPRHNPFSNYDKEAVVDPSSNLPIVLAQGFHDGIVVPRHVILPAHVKDGNFGSLHKLGDKGPLCMSSVHDAMSMMQCTHAFPVTETN